jgi:hypothetical protein
LHQSGEKRTVAESYFIVGGESDTAAVLERKKCTDLSRRKAGPDAFQ